MKKSDLIEAWLNSEISEDEAILILERLKHDESFKKELVNSGEIHAALYTIFHEENSFEQLKLHEASKSPDEIEDQIMHMIASGNSKVNEKKKRITVIDLPQNVRLKTKRFEKPRNYWPLFGSIAAILAIILSIAILSKKDTSPQAVEKNHSLSEDETVSLVEDAKKKTSQNKKNQDHFQKNENKQTVKPLKVVSKEEDLSKKAEAVEPEKQGTQVVIEARNLLDLGLVEGASEYCTILRKGSVIDVVPGIKIEEGDELSTSYESPVKVKLHDGSYVELGMNSTAIFSNQKIKISSGVGIFDVSKQKEGQFKVISGDTTTTVVGTKFTVSYLEKLSLVKVQGGVVKVKSKGHEVTLEKGQGAISRDGKKPQKRDFSEQFGLLAAKWNGDQIGPQVGVLEYDITDFVTSKGYHDLYFKNRDIDGKGMLQIFKVEFYENGKLINVDEHNGVTSNHTTDLRNRNVWLHGGYGSSMYRMYLKKFSIQSKYTIRVRCRSFKGSCDGEIWLLSTIPDSQTLIPGIIPTGKNLAYRKKVSTENEAESKNHGPEMVVDNKINAQSSWWGAGSKWVQVDLGKATNFNSMLIANFWEQNCYHQYFVEVSKNGENWERVIDMTANTLPAHETGQFHRFDSVDAQFIRMTVDGVKFSQGGISVVELKVFDFHK